MKTDREQNGFTLIEIMVALFIVAITLGTLVSASGRYIDSTAHLKNLTFAHWVAENKATEILINKGNVSTLGEQTGTVTMAKRQWVWKIVVTPTPDDSVKKIIVTVTLPKSKNKHLAKLVTYVNH